MRLWCLAMVAPALWLVWLIVEGSAAKALLLAVSGGWLIAVFRVWRWSGGRR
jgi:hypothetical protein